MLALSVIERIDFALKESFHLAVELSPWEVIGVLDICWIWSLKH